MLNPIQSNTGLEELSIWIHAKASKKAETYTHPDLKTRTERARAIFFYRDPKEWNRLGLQRAEWSVNTPCSTVRFWELWRSQRMRFWSQLQGNRQVMFLTCRIISSLVEKHIVSHLSDFLAFMLHLHSMKREQVIYHHRSDQHGHILRIQCLSPNSHISEKKKFSEEINQLKVFSVKCRNIILKTHPQDKPRCRSIVFCSPPGRGEACEANSDLYLCITSIFLT